MSENYLVGRVPFQAEKIAVSSVSPISKTGGFVQIFDSLNANRQHILQPSITGLQQ